MKFFMKSQSSDTGDVYWQLLGTLFLLCRKIARGGLLLIDDDVEHPETSELFNAINPYDQANAAVYTFICDVVRMMITNSFRQIDDLERYADAYRKTSVHTDEQSAMFDCARLFLIAMFSGHSPAIAVEYGRQGIPAKVKPSYQELENFIHRLKSWPPPTAANQEAKLEDFFASLGG
jgi:flagellar motor component MotA